MRSDLQIDREKGAKIVLKRPIDTKRFQRIRSFLENRSYPRNMPGNSRVVKREEKIE
jgi:hypothetical protein